MTVIMKGNQVVEAMKEKIAGNVEILVAKGITPGLAIVRVGERPDDLSYENSAVKRCGSMGIKCIKCTFPGTVSQTELTAAIENINNDESIHGVLIFSPLPKHLDEKQIRGILKPEKDMDCITGANTAKVFEGDATGFAPCTAEAVIRVLDHYGIEVKGKRAVIIGRSMVVGKPLSMLMLGKDATVTVCHSKSDNLKEICKEADILVAAVGRTRMVTAEYIKDGAVAVDVGINVDEAGNLCGDIDYNSAAEVAGFITPVPGGVGGVTTAVLAEHVVRAALNSIRG